MDSCSFRKFWQGWNLSELNLHLVRRRHDCLCLHGPHPCKPMVLNHGLHSLRTPGGCFRYIFLVLLGGGEGGVRVAGGLLKIPGRGVPPRKGGGGARAGGVSAGNLWRGGGGVFFFSGPKFPLRNQGPENPCLGTGL